jgi:hypothetical protein
LTVRVAPTESVTVTTLSRPPITRLPDADRLNARETGHAVNQTHSIDRTTIG